MKSMAQVRLANDAPMLLASPLQGGSISRTISNCCISVAQHSLQYRQIELTICTFSCSTDCSKQFWLCKTSPTEGQQSMCLNSSKRFARHSKVWNMKHWSMYIVKGYRSNHSSPSTLNSVVWSKDLHSYYMVGMHCACYVCTTPCTQK